MKFLIKIHKIYMKSFYFHNSNALFFLDIFTQKLRYHQKYLENIIRMKFFEL